MASVTNIVGQVIDYVYTWLPKTANNRKGQVKDSRKRKKRVNFSQPLKEKGEDSYQPLVGLGSSHGFPSTPTGSKVMLLRSFPSECGNHWAFSQKPSNCNLKVVGCKFFSKEKKISKRSALKRWLRQRTTVVCNENFHLDEQLQCAAGRHSLCFREVFECSPRLADSRYQRGLNLGLKGRRKVPWKQWSREPQDKTIDDELNETKGSLVDLSESLSVLRVRPSYA